MTEGEVLRLPGETDHAYRSRLMRTKETAERKAKIDRQRGSAARTRAGKAARQNPKTNPSIPPRQ